MNNCLLTKLKGEVNNPKLPEFGYFKATQKNTGNIIVRIDTGYTIKADKPFNLLVSNRQYYDLTEFTLTDANSPILTLGVLSENTTFSFPKYNTIYMPNYWTVEGVIDYYMPWELNDLDFVHYVSQSVTVAIPQNVTGSAPLYTLNCNISGHVKIANLKNSFLDLRLGNSQVNYYQTCNNYTVEIGDVNLPNLRTIQLAYAKFDHGSDLLTLFTPNLETLSLAACEGINNDLIPWAKSIMDGRIITKQLADETTITRPLYVATATQFGVTSLKWGDLTITQYLSQVYGASQWSGYIYFNKENGKVALAPTANLDPSDPTQVKEWF